MGVKKKKIHKYSRKYIVYQEVTNDMEKMEGAEGVERVGACVCHGRSVLNRKVSLMESYLS